MVLKNGAFFSQLALLNSVDDAIKSAPKDRKPPPPPPPPPPPLPQQTHCSISIALHECSG